MLAYKQGITKKDFIKEMKAHQKADDFVRGSYDSGTGGCSIGCALKSVMHLKGIKLNPGDHAKFETHLGVPKWLALLNDKLFENISASRIRTWPVEFSEAINEGSNLEEIRVPYLIYILEQNLITLDSLKVDDQFTEVLAAIQGSKDATKQMIKAQKSKNQKKIEAARSAAWSAAWSAWSAESAARSAAWSAARSAAESAAWSAARSAAESAARSAAESAARSAAESAAWSAESAARSAAWSAAWSATFDKHADKLLEMMRACK